MRHHFGHVVEYHHIRISLGKSPAVDNAPRPASKETRVISREDYKNELPAVLAGEPRESDPFTKSQRGKSSLIARPSRIMINTTILARPGVSYHKWPIIPGTPALNS